MSAPVIKFVAVTASEHLNMNKSENSAGILAEIASVFEFVRWYFVKVHANFKNDFNYEQFHY